MREEPSEGLIFAIRMMMFMADPPVNARACNAGQGTPIEWSVSRQTECPVKMLQ
jgi:hypothetical protein